MQAASSIYLTASSPLLPSCSTKTKTTTKKLFPTCLHKRIQTSSSRISMKAAASSSSEAPEVDYSSMESSVFPAEACDTLGGVACDVEMFPETKLKQQQQQEKEDKVTSQKGGVDREYLQYDSPKTVFIAEACDDLGGEFCEPRYQTGSN